jgi:Na+-driven multidrug efflux pump
MFMAALGLGLVVLAPQVVGLFTSDPEILRHGMTCLRILGIGFPLYAVGMIMIQALNGAGDTRTPSLLNFVCFWMLQIPLAYWLAQDAGLGPTGVFIAIVLSESILSILGLIVFRRGAWKTQLA